MSGMRQREHHWDRIRTTEEWDVVIIGGGASGLGIAVHAASSGLKTALFERDDFAKGTSSKSTKLIHGGVRYLQQGNIKLVKESLRERGLLMQNAPHLVQNMKFVLPTFKPWRTWYYALGLKVYDRLAGRLGLGRSESLSKEETVALLPGIKTDEIAGGASYHDGQFDDAYLALSLAKTAVHHGAALLNYCEVTSFISVNKRIQGVEVHSPLDAEKRNVRARFVINATGPFSDSMMALDNPKHKPVIKPSQGTHVVVDSSFFPGNTAMLIPKTDDGRILFAVPWHGKIILGTTDTPVDAALAEPVPFDSEIDFILTHLQRYLRHAPQRTDVLSAFSGIRPLVKLTNKKTAELARDHVIRVSRSGLISILGGKWTTYRKMAADVMRKIQSLSSEKIALSDTRMLRLVDCNTPPLSPSIENMNDAELKERIRLEVEQSACLTVEDFLARRTRQLLLDARHAIKRAPFIAACLAEQLIRDETWKTEQIESFNALAQLYLPQD